MCSSLVSMLRAAFLLTALSVAQGNFSFVAVADWGGLTNQRPTTKSQRLTGAAMMGKARTMGANFTLMMGDNYYWHGVDCPADLSPRFKQTFEDVYAAFLPEGKFYAIAGNHDYGQGQMANISAQLAYSNISSHWNFPALWYSLRRRFTVDGKERTFKLVLIDTVVLCGNGHKNEHFIDVQLEFLGQKADATRPGHLRRQVAERQWAWLERELAESSDIDYLWVSGHYPIYSIGYWGSQQCLIDRLLPLLKTNNAQYISGHDHNLVHVVDGHTNMFVVGAGMSCCYPSYHLRSVPRGFLRFMVAARNGRSSQPPIKEPVLGGFAAVHFGGEFAWVTLHKHTGDVLYSAPRIPRRGTVSRLTFITVIPICLVLAASAAMFVYVPQRSASRQDYILLSE